MTTTLDLLESLFAERDRTCNIRTLTRNGDAIASEVSVLVPLLREWADSIAAYHERAWGDTRPAARVDAAERALLAALRTAPAGEAP